MNMHREKAMLGYREKVGIYKPKREAWGKTSLASRNLILDFQSPNCEKINFCCFATSLVLLFCYDSPSRLLQKWSIQLRGTEASASLASSSSPIRQTESHITITATPTLTLDQWFSKFAKHSHPWKSSSNIILYESLSNLPKWCRFFPYSVSCFMCFCTSIAGFI